MRRKKVLHMPIANTGGGITRYAREIQRFIDKDEFVCDFVTRSPVLDFAEQLTRAGGKVHYLSCSSLEDEERFVSEMRGVLDEGYDIVHLHTSYWKGFLAEQLAMEHGCPMVIVHAHSMMVDLENGGERARAIALHEKLKCEFSPSFATHFCACSNAAAEWLFGDAVDGNRIRILKNAVDTDRFAFNPRVRQAVRGELGLDGCFVLGNAGRFAYQKNHEMLLDIFARIYQVNSKARLILVGNGPLKEQIRQKAERLGVVNSILFMGKLDDVSNIMQAMDVYLQPSRFEGLSLVLLEAQVAGLKCLASEFMTPETRVTPNLDFVAYNVDDWVKATIEYSGGHERVDCSRLVAEAGHDMRVQIGVIENLYRSGTEV